jgi:hypothetical protein
VTMYFWKFIKSSQTNPTSQSEAYCAAPQAPQNSTNFTSCKISRFF